MDDEIIYSWCFHDVECFDSTPFAAIIILDKDLESFSSLRSQQDQDPTGVISRRFITHIARMNLERPSKIRRSRFICNVSPLQNAFGPLIEP